MLKYINNRKATIIRNGFGKWWLRNLVGKLGGDWMTLDCHGEITGYGLNGDILTINQCTA